jgi:hypothetical protein
VIKAGRDCVHLGWPAESPTFLSYCCYCLPAQASCWPHPHTLQLFSSGSQVSSSAGRVCRSSKSPSQQAPHLWRAAGSCNRCHTGRQRAPKHAHRAIRWKPLEAVKERKRQPLVPGTTTQMPTRAGGQHVRCSSCLIHARIIVLKRHDGSRRADVACAVRTLTMGSAACQCHHGGAGNEPPAAHEAADVAKMMVRARHADQQHAAYPIEPCFSTTAWRVCAWTYVFAEWCPGFL